MAKCSDDFSGELRVPSEEYLITNGESPRVGGKGCG